MEGCSQPKLCLSEPDQREDDDHKRESWRQSKVGSGSVRSDGMEWKKCEKSAWRQLLLGSKSAINHITKVCKITKFNSFSDSKFWWLPRIGIREQIFPHDISFCLLLLWQLHTFYRHYLFFDARLLNESEVVYCTRRGLKLASFVWCQAI